MTGQVNRLIGNRLAADCELFLPGVGSLYVEQRGARRISKREVEPPCRVVRFSPQERGASLVDEIAAAARCDQERAQAIYDRWLDHVLGENTLTIEGVGELRFRNFTPEAEFDLLLNPQGHAPVKVKTAGGRTFWVCLLVAAAVIVIGYGLFSGRPAFDRFFGRTAGEYNSSAVSEGLSSDDSSLAEPLSGPVGPGAAGSGAADVSGSPVAGTAVQGTAAASSGGRIPDTPAPASSGRSGSGTAQAPASFVPGHHYVVAGVFGQPENADRTAEQIERDDPTLHCTVYRFGDKLLVSPFSSADLTACQRFMRAHRDRWPEVWTYSAR